MHLNRETIEIQHQLADYCKNGSYEHIIGVQKDKVEHYRRLVFNNVKSALERAYPICLKWLSHEEWLLLVNDSFAHHQIHTPKIWEMPQEFMDYAIENNYGRKLDKPALHDLLLLEWVEVEVHTMMDKPSVECARKGDVAVDQLVLTPEYRLIKLEYPVHAFNASEAASIKGNWFIYVFRNRASDGVQFLNVSALHAFFIEKLYEQSQSLNTLLPIISSVFDFDDIPQLKTHLVKFINDLQQKGALLGFIS